MGNRWTTTAPDFVGRLRACIGGFGRAVAGECLRNVAIDSTVSIFGKQGGDLNRTPTKWDT
ncbi:hypothetical protein C7S14_1740 [Burkholderia cepacia]|nr:hypothetical protein C7S14_1740 [Burkholderia cepacia]